ncbi:hypothetical protein [Neobacillus niacini]|uniref:hypothetical protein n=1 Tax=Neobacillus niacini TaxID=86668 RepID=UPI003982DD17
MKIWVSSFRYVVVNRTVNKSETANLMGLAVSDFNCVWRFRNVRFDYGTESNLTIKAARMKKRSG